MEARNNYKNSIIYCRISSKWQEEWGWLNSQEVSCRNYCNRQWYKIVEVFQDSFTGWDLDRPWINALFKFIDDYNSKNTGKIDVFVVDDINRIARSYEVHLAITRELRKRDIAYETVNMKFEDTPIGKLIEGIMALNSEFFRIENKARVISRQESRLLDGYRPWDYPIGYRNENAPVGGKMLVIDAPNASKIKQALEGYADGLFNSTIEVAQFLEKQGIDMRKYKKKRKDSTKIHPSFAQRVLKNILYTGYIEYKAITRNKDWSIKKHWDISLRKGKHEGIISLETHYKIQEKLKSKRPYTKAVLTINDDYPLRWSLVCNCCWLHITSGKSRSKSKKQIAYYQSNKKCINHSKSISSDLLHNQMKEILAEIGVNKNFLGFMKILIQKEYNDRNENKALSNKQLDKSLVEIDKEIDNLVSAIASSWSEIVRKKLEQKVEEKELERLKIEWKIRDNKADIWISKTLDIAFKTLENPLYIWEKGTIDQRQMLLKLVFSKKIPIDFSTGIYWTPPYSSLYLHLNNISEQDLRQLEVMGFEPMSESRNTKRLPL